MDKLTRLSLAALRWTHPLDNQSFPVAIVREDQLQALERQNAEMLEALKWMTEAFCPGADWKGVPVYDAAQGAISKATGETK